MTNQINTPAEFSQAIKALMNNEEARTALLEKMLELCPGNPEVELAHQYFTSSKFRAALNDHLWQQACAQTP